jgi:hypothetical protein
MHFYVTVRPVLSRVTISLGVKVINQQVIFGVHVHLEVLGRQ